MNSLLVLQTRLKIIFLLLYHKYTINILKYIHRKNGEGAR